MVGMHYFLVIFTLNISKFNKFLLFTAIAIYFVLAMHSLYAIFQDDSNRRSIADQHTSPSQSHLLVDSESVYQTNA